MIDVERWFVVVRWSLFLGLMACCGPLAGQQAPWRRPYTGGEATGDGVIALWHFDARAEAEDSSGNGHKLALRGQTRFAPHGRFGGCLESFPAGPESDRPQGALVRNHPDLSPPGAFTLEMWLKAKPEMDQYSEAFLLDKKYYHYPKDLPQANWDYCLFMRRAGLNRWRLIAFLGFGRDSAAFSSRVVTIELGRWYHVAFVYDGAGTGRLFLDGQCVGRTKHEGRGAVAPGRYGLVIGCRYGSTHVGFPGYIDEVRISRGVAPWFAGALALEAAGKRLAFRRMEKDARLAVDLINDTDQSFQGARVRMALAGQTEEVEVGEVAPHQVRTVDIPLDTTLRPGRYPVQLSAMASGGGKTFDASLQVSITIVPRPLPDRMPVVMWGSGELETVKQIGFTHQLVSMVDYGRVWSASSPVAAVSEDRQSELAELLDRYLTEGMGAVANVYPGRWIMGREELKEKFRRVDRRGKPYSREDVCARFPGVQAFAYNVGASVAQTFGRFPAFQAALIHTEVRDATNLCFHDHDRQAFRREAGFDIPREVVGKWGVDYTKLESFPENRIIPDDHPILTFYRWFWKEGDGWNRLHTEVHRGLKSTGRDDLWTFFDPAVRVPSVWGSGGGVDVISQWTYSYPDPIKIGQATDELFAMAQGAPHRQKVMKMTQIIWYRSQTAPELPGDESARAEWERRVPDARFITIAPDHLREAFWSKISRPVAGIMYHGWGSLVEAPHGSYRFTHPGTREVLAELVRTVARPLGPTLVQVPDRPSDVGLLESFAAQMFAGRGTYGWSHRWEADMHLILQWAHLQPRILYDETVLRDGLDGLRVLVLPHCDVLTEKVAAAIERFQRRGGIVVADEYLAPALRADIVVPSYRRTGQADRDKEALLAKAAALRKRLDPLYQRYGDSSHPDIIPRFRRYGTTDYLFLVNDKRTFGRYVGHHGKVMEKGLPQSATIEIRRPTGHVYDLVRHQPVKTANEAGRLRLPIHLGPGGGTVLMISEKRVSRIRIEAPDEAQPGDSITIRVAVTDETQQPLDAVVPVQLEILDPEQKPAEFTGHYGARDGRLEVTLDLAGNDTPGPWTIRATELASGKTGQRQFTVIRRDR